MESELPTKPTPVVQNLSYPFENHTLGSTNNSFFYNDLALHFGSVESIASQLCDFRALIPATNWAAPTPALTKFAPGHDPQIGIDNSTSSP